jgi:hypothetical protein
LVNLNQPVFELSWKKCGKFSNSCGTLGWHLVAICTQFRIRVIQEAFMTDDPIRLPRSTPDLQANLDLLKLIWAEDVKFPWNPADPEAEACLADLEAQVAAVGWTEEDFASSAQAVAVTLDQAWSRLATAESTGSTGSSVSLNAIATSFQDEATRARLNLVPQQVIDVIFRRAQQMLDANLSLAEQLVACVQESLPGWGNDDLQVLARPLAYAMRDSGDTAILESALKTVRCIDWTELSGVEQARLSLAIARYALAQRSESNSETSKNPNT